MPPKKQKVDDSQDQTAADNVKIATQPRTRGRITRSTAQLAPSLPEVVAKRQSTGTFNTNSSHRDEEAGKERRVMGASLMTNVLALADTLGVKKDFHVDADQLLFLDTVRVIAVVPDVAVVPAKMQDNVCRIMWTYSGVYEKILSGIQETKSLRVAVASFRLLHDLDLRHPQVNLKSNGAGEKKKFVDNKEQVWSPFEVAAQRSDNTKQSTKVSMDLYTLLENIADDLDGEQTSKKRSSSGIDIAARNKDPLNRLVQYLMLRWLVSLLDSDFQVRQQAFQENPEELELLQESLILRFLMRQDNPKVKDIFTNLLRIIAKPGELEDLKGGSESQDPEISATPSGTSSVSSSPGFFVTETDFAHLAATLLTMILELEDFKDLSYSKIGPSRKSVSIRSLAEIFMGVLEYGKTYLCPVLQMLENPQLKFKLILKFFVAHAPGNTRDKLREVSTPKQMFDCVSNMNLHKTFYPEELQILLAGAFQVFLETHTSDDELLREVCSSFQAAVSTLNAKMECEDTHHHARCALVIANVLINS